MIKYIAFISFFLISINAVAQTEVLELPVNYQSVYYNGKESLALSNNSTGELVVFIEDGEKTKAFLLDKTFKLICNIETPSLPNSFKDFIGYQVNNDDTYSIYFTNNSNKKYGVLNLDFINKKTNTKTLDFKLKKETYVEGISHKGKFYLMSVTKNGSNVYFYTFKDDNFIADKNTVSFDFLEALTINGFSAKASHVLVSKGIGGTGSLTKIDVNSPNAIETTSKPTKLYIIDNKFVFTFDESKNKTIVVSISPETFEKDIKEFKKPLMSDSSITYNHNSYLFDNKIFQIKSTPLEMKFTVKDFGSKNILKEIQLKKSDSITFKNTPIIQEGPGFIAGTRIREMEQASKFLRKISRGDIGVSVYKQNDNYTITLGSKLEIQRGGGFAPGFGGAIGGAVIGGLSFNPTFAAYGGYSSSKSTRIDCLFNLSFDHLQGEIEDNIFDRINFYEDLKNERTGVKLKNIFKHQNKLYLGYIDKIDKNYHLVEFLE